VADEEGGGRARPQRAEELLAELVVAFPDEEDQRVILEALNERLSRRPAGTDRQGDAEDPTGV
jgi:hypothetical protein